MGRVSVVVFLLACASVARAQEPPSSAPNFRLRVRADLPGYVLYDQIGFTVAQHRQPSTTIMHYLCDAPCTAWLTPGIHVLDYERPGVSLRSLTAFDVDGPTRIDIASEHTSHDSVRVAGGIVLAAALVLAAFAVPLGFALDQASSDARAALIGTGGIGGFIGLIVGICLACVGDDEGARAVLTGET